jgi:hypothetical protein
VPRPDRSPSRRVLDLDLVALVPGLLALGVALIYLAAEAAGRSVRPGGVVAYVVGVLAVAGLLAGLRRALRERSG